jgi:hypothetical protein
MTAIIAVRSHTEQELHEGPARVLGPSGPWILGSSVYDDQLGAVVTAEQVGGSVTNPTFWADLVGIQPQGWAGRACRSVEAIRDQFIRIFGAKARVRRVAAAAGGTDHPLGEGSGCPALRQLDTVANAETMPGCILRQTHRATLH